MPRRIAIIAVALFVLMAAPAVAAPTPPTGTIELMPVGALASSAGPQYGDYVGFLTTVEGKISKQARVYVTVVCLQGDNVVYQYSGAPDFSFPLLDQAGLEWDGGAAYCEAWLIHRVKKGRASEITYLDSVAFGVAG